MHLIPRASRAATSPSPYARAQARCSPGSSSGRAVAPARRDRMPASTTNRCWVVLSRSATDSLRRRTTSSSAAPSETLRTVCCHPGPRSREARCLGEPRQQRGARRAPGRHGDQPDVLPRHRRRPGVHHAEQVVPPVERDALAGRRSVLAPDGRDEVSPAGRAAVDDRLLPGRDQCARHVARTDDHEDPVPGELAHEPARVTRPSQGELLLGHHDGRPAVRCHHLEQPAERSGGLAAVLAAHALAEQVVRREALGTLVPGIQHAVRGEPPGGGGEGSLDRGRPRLVEPHVEVDVCHGGHARNGAAPGAWGCSPAAGREDPALRETYPIGPRPARRVTSVLLCAP